MSIWIDITEFITHPHRTGIQRVTAELCRHWPKSVAAVPVKVRSDGRLVRLPVETLALIAVYFRPPAGSTDIPLKRIRDINEEADRSGSEVVLCGRDVLLCPEVFFDRARIGFYHSLPTQFQRRCCFVVYDLLLLTHPQYYPAETPHDIICKYFCLLREIGHLAFISKATQSAFYNRLLRTYALGGRVIRLGSDGLGERRHSTSVVRPAAALFVMIGTIEPRKNHLLVLDAFELLVNSYANATLAFVGRVGWLTTEARARLEKFQRQYNQFSLITGADDSTVRDAVLGARATLFVSAVEGFGLPPVESLWLGTPVIASPGLPSLEEVGEVGVHRVAEVNAHTVSDAMVQFLDDPYWQKKRREASDLDLPDWKSFATNVAEWVDQIHRAV